MTSSARVPWRWRLQGWFWDHSPLWRRPLRRFRLTASLVLHRLRNWRGPVGSRVVSYLQRHRHSDNLQHPAVRLIVAEGTSTAQAAAWLARQTETSVVLDGALGESASRKATHASPLRRQTVPGFVLTYHPDLEVLPAALLESLLLVAAVENVGMATAGFALPSPTEAGPDGRLLANQPQATLLRLPSPLESTQVVGRVVPHITDGDDSAKNEPSTLPGLATRLATRPATRQAGPYWLRGDLDPGKVLHHGVYCPRHRLANLPDNPGPRTTLFLLPFLAVGGAERLLFDLLAGLGESTRCLVVTLEPHRQDLGQTVQACRELTPHVYTLGDWLPREVHVGAVSHLLRRYQVDNLVCWNGVVAFYDAARQWKKEFPRLRLLNQLYNHAGGWIEHYGPRFAAAVDQHLAINGAIAEALQRRGVAAERIATLHHGVRVPDLPSDEEARRRRSEAHRVLGLEDLEPGTLVVGTFIRLHAQKRPLDVLAVAQRFVGRGVHFLLVGGGPLDDEVDGALAARPHPNVTRLPLRRDLDTLYAAVDLCLLTSDYEGLPIFLLDGLARQVPCVATAVGEIPELLTDGGGILVQRPGDIDALAQGIETLRDPECRAAAGQCGRRTVEAHFGLETYCQRYAEALYPAANNSAPEQG